MNVNSSGASLTHVAVEKFDDCIKRRVPLLEDVSVATERPTVAFSRGTMRTRIATFTDPKKMFPPASSIEKLNFWGEAPGNTVALLPVAELTGFKLEGVPLELTLITADVQYVMFPLTLAPKTTPAFCVLEENASHH